MRTIFSIDTAFPPSLANQLPLAMLTVMSFWAVFLICLQWIYEILEQSRELPAPRGSYLRAARRVRLWLVVAALILTTPRLGTLMLWQLMSASEREMMSVVAWVVCIPAAMMVTFAWWTNNSAVKTETRYSVERGFHMADATTKMEKTRGLIVLLVVFAIAFATTFIRPGPHADAPRTAISERH